MRRNVSFDEVPGFQRLTGPMTMIAVTVAIALALSSLRIWLFCGASLVWFFVLAAALFVLLQWGGRLLFGCRRQPPGSPGRTSPSSTAAWCLSLRR